MRLGVTGSRTQRTLAQAWTFGGFLELLAVTELHHGDCTGADALMAHRAELQNITTVAHPPENGKHRAFHQSSIIEKPLPYLERNRSIVDACDLLVAMPDGPERSGFDTWYTINYARSIGKPVQVIWPNGKVTAS